jgi:DNA-binding protein Alba
MPTDTTFIIKNRSDMDKTIKDVIFAFSGGTKSLLIKGEGEEISTAVEVAEILKTRMYPGVEIANISLGSRPFFKNNQYGKQRKYYKNSPNQKDLISKIEITLSKSIS